MLLKKSAFLTLLILITIALEAKAQTEDDNSASITSEVLQRSTLADAYYGFNGANFLKDIYIDDTGLDSVMDSLKPKMIRFPGGTLANYWDWKKGWFLDLPYQEPVPPAPYIPPLPIVYQNMEAREVNLEDLKNSPMIEGRNTKVVWVLNVLTSTLDYQLEFLQHAKDLGFEVEFIELGNELYNGNPDNDNDRSGPYRKIFPTGKDYCNAMNPWITAIKDKFSDAKISVTMANYHSSDDPRFNNWNDDIFIYCKGIYAGSLHPYRGTGLRKAGDPLPSFNPDDRDTALTILQQPDSWARNIKRNVIDQMAAHNLKTWLTEFNFYEIFNTEIDGTVFHGTWLHALYLAEMSLEFWKQPNVEVALIHSIVSGGAFGMTFSNETGYYAPSFEKVFPYEGPQSRGPVTEPLGLTTLGRIMKFLTPAMTAQGSVSDVIFTPNIENTLKGYKIYRTASSRPMWVLINRESTQQMVVSGGINFTGNYQISTLSSAAKTRMDVKTYIFGTTSSVQSNTNITLPPLSISIVLPAP